METSPDPAEHSAPDAASPDASPARPATELGMAATLAAGVGDEDPAEGTDVDRASREGARATARPLDAGAVVGRYVVLSPLGAGGMGMVYAAYDPELDRKVALKLLLPGIGGEGGRARLWREAQALGKLAHPHVVAIYDVGSFGDQVWLAMELVEGQTLRAWQQAARSWKEVVTVMIAAGEGLAAAHAAGLLHRDFKPDNIMVGDDGRVRVMDFGLARAQSEDGSSVDTDEPSMPGPTVGALSTELTRAGALLGTPSYMAPEQFGRAEVTAAADQFALCVTLWEALYGVRPFGGETPLDVITNILEGRRQTPSADRAVPGRLRRACERGLAANPEQRWPSIEDLLVELRACVAPRRRRWVALGVTAGLLSVGVGLGAQRYASWAHRCTGSRTQLDGIWDEGRRGRVQAALSATGLSYAAQTWPRVEQRLDDYAQAWAAKHQEVCAATQVRQEQSESDMSLRMQCLHRRRVALGSTVDVLAEADETVVEHAVRLVAELPGLARCDDLEALRAAVPPPEDPQVAEEVEGLRERLVEIHVEMFAGRFVSAQEAIESVTAEAAQLGYAPLLAEAKLGRGALRNMSGRFTDAEDDLLDAHALAIEHRHDEVALRSSMALTTVVGRSLVRPAEGRMWGRMASAHARRNGDELAFAKSLTYLGNVLEREGDLDQAERYYVQAYEIQQRVLGPDDIHVGVSLMNLGDIFDARGRLDQAVLHYEDALRIFEDAVGPHHPDVATLLDNLGTVLLQRGQVARAQQQHERALQIFEDALGPEHPYVAKSLTNLGNVFFERGELLEAEQRHERALGIMEDSLGPDHPHVATVLLNLSGVLLRRREYASAGRRYARALQIFEERFGDDHPDVAYALIGLVDVALEQEDFETARRLAERAAAIRQQGQVMPSQLAEVWFRQARALWSKTSTQAQARQLAEQARRAYADGGSAQEESRAEVERWLDEHPVPQPSSPADP